MKTIARYPPWLLCTLIRGNGPVNIHGTSQNHPDHSSEPERRPIPVTNEAKSRHIDILVGCQRAKQNMGSTERYLLCMLSSPSVNLFSRIAITCEANMPIWTICSRLTHSFIKGSQGPTLHDLQGHLPCQATSPQTSKAMCERTSGRGTSVHPRPSDHPSLLGGAVTGG